MCGFLTWCTHADTNRGEKRKTELLCWTSRCLQLNCQCFTGLKQPCGSQDCHCLHKDSHCSHQVQGTQDSHTVCGLCSLKTWRKQTFMGGLGENWKIWKEYRKKEECDTPAGFWGLRLKADQQQVAEFCIPEETQLEAWVYMSPCPDGKVKCRK